MSENSQALQSSPPSEEDTESKLVDVVMELIGRLDALEDRIAGTAGPVTPTPAGSPVPVAPAVTAATVAAQPAPAAPGPAPAMPSVPVGETSVTAEPATPPVPAEIAPAVEAHPPTTPVLAGSGIPPAIATLPVPRWNQRINDNPDDPSRDRFADTDCGEQSACMVTYSAQRVEIDEGLVRGFIHQQFPGQQQGLTDGNMLAWYLSSRHNNCPHAHVVSGNSMAAIKGELADGCLAIVLGSWYQGTEHWVVARGYDDNHLIYNDPWVGEMRAVTWNDFLTRVDRGSVVATRATARYE